MSSLTRLVRHKSGMALAWLHMFITFGKQRSGHSPCAIISRFQSQIGQVRGAISINKLHKDSDPQCNVINTDFNTIPPTNLLKHVRHILTSKKRRIGVTSVTAHSEKKVMSRAPLVEGSNWNVTGTETWISGTATW